MSEQLCSIKSDCTHFQTLQIMAEDQGHKTEQEIYEQLCCRFGADCVYLSPKVPDSKGEKEVCDILVLALPYAIAFQIKWKKSTADDLQGVNADVKRKRLIRTMEKAAGQFAEICSTIAHAKVIEVPRVWEGCSSETYMLPMDVIEHLIPIVIVDFEDVNYSDPDKRYSDVPPVLHASSFQAEKYGIVHSFLKRDFLRIIDQLFSVGDLMLWLSARERLIGNGNRAFIGYHELTLFMLYLFNNPLFNEMMEYDGVLLDDNTLFEYEIEKHKVEFDARKRKFEDWILLDMIEAMLAKAARRMYAETNNNEIILAYLQVVGRFKRLYVLARQELSRKIKKNLEQFKPCAGKCMYKGTYSFFGQGTTSNTLFYLAACDFIAETGESCLEYGYLRALSNACARKREKSIKEVLVLLVRQDRPDICARLFPVVQSDFNAVLAKEELERSRVSFSESKTTTTEWKYVKGL